MAQVDRSAKVFSDIMRPMVVLITLALWPNPGADILESYFALRDEDYKGLPSDPAMIDAIRDLLESE